MTLRSRDFLEEVAYQNGNFSWSHSLLQEAARQREHDPSILHHLAWAAYSLGRVNEARDVMQKAMAIDSQFPEVADAKKFLSLIAFEENPKESEDDANGSKSNYKRILNICLLSWPKLRSINSTAKKSQPQRYTSIFYVGYRIFRLPKNVLPYYTLKNHPPPLQLTIWQAKAHKTSPDDAELAQLLGRLSYEKQEYPRASSYCKRALKNGRSTPILSSVWDVPTAEQTKGRGKRDP